MKKKNKLISAPKRKQPTQKRSQLIVESIIIAAQKILAEEGSRALNTNYVAEVAGVNIASLYRWFPNKEAIIEGVIEAMLNEEMAMLNEMLKQINDFQLQPGIMTVDNMLSFIIDSTIMRHQRLLSLHGSFYQENVDSFSFGDRGVLDTNQSWIDISAEWLATFVREQRPDLTAEEASLRAFIVTRAIQGTCRSTASERPELLSEERFRQSLFTLAEGHLRLDQP